MEENEGFDMHNGDKIGSTAIGRLTWSRSKIMMNELKPRQELIGKFYKIGKHFNKS